MPSTPAEIPKRALFKASEVCEIAKIQPFILRSWETEFPDLGVGRGADVSRVYRRSDVERVLRIKHLLFVEGLTLAGVRRRLGEGKSEDSAEELPAIEDVLRKEVRTRLGDVTRGLRSILELLSRGGGSKSVEGSPLFTLHVRQTRRTSAAAPRKPSPHPGRTSKAGHRKRA
ncbi:MAG: MerR family transcriptional regulator [Acidobacteria bacterium]|nr:MerR family transcriptional regulator [Acidobacteriota bacterium]